jgi:hypothetical protein
VIDDEVGEFSTPLRFISDNWGLEPLTDRIRNTHNFEHVFDFARNPRAPKLGKEQAPTTSTIWKFPGETYTGWEPGTVPVDNPL